MHASRNLRVSSRLVDVNRMGLECLERPRKSSSPGIGSTWRFFGDETSSCCWMSLAKCSSCRSLDFLFSIVLVDRLNGADDLSGFL